MWISLFDFTDIVYKVVVNCDSLDDFIPLKLLTYLGHDIVWFIKKPANNSSTLGNG